ncbi:MAG: hypothetical protein EA338_04170 [Roseinatronobacter sp.]|nr:MAG: hypothetical protein EA338_04170 [Roseinatronobacter sp.]
MWCAARSCAHFGAWVGQNVAFCRLRLSLIAVCFKLQAQEGSAMFACPTPRSILALRGQP